MDLFDLMAKITLDSSEYEKGLEDSEKQASSFGQSLKNGLGKAAKVSGVALAAVGTGAVALGASMLNGAKKTAAYGDEIDKNSQKMGISAEAYQEWDFILQHSGSSIGGLQKGMMTLSNAAAKNSKAFQKLGISEDKVADMNQEELFSAVISGLQGMEEGAERTALAQELLGGAAKELGPLLNTSAEDTEAMRQQVHDLGGVMSDDAVKAAAGFQDSMQNMGVALSGLKNGVISQFLPGITSVMDGLTSIFSGDTDSGVDMITTGITSILDNITENMPLIIQAGSDIISGILTAITDNLPSLIESGATLLLNLILGIAQQLPRLIELMPKIIAGLVKALIASAPQLLAAGMKIIETIVIGIAKLYNRLIAAGSAVIASIKVGISAKIEALKTWIITKFDTIGAKIVAPFDTAKTKIQGIITKIKNMFNFTAKTPKIKLPHFVIEPEGWKIGDLLKGTIPSLSIKWYKKAYETPYMFSQPTVAMGFGDGKGGEMVYGHENLMNDIREAASNDEKLDIIIDLLSDIVHNGLKADINRNQLYKTMASMNRSRNYATGYNGFAGV